MTTRLDDATLRRLSVEASCDPRTVAKVYAGEAVRGDAGLRARGALERAGLLKGAGGSGGTFFGYTMQKTAPHLELMKANLGPPPASAREVERVVRFCKAASEYLDSASELQKATGHRANVVKTIASGAAKGKLEPAQKRADEAIAAAKKFGREVLMGPGRTASEPEKSALEARFEDLCEEARAAVLTVVGEAYAAVGTTSDAAEVEAFAATARTYIERGVNLRDLAVD